MPYTPEQQFELMKFLNKSQPQREKTLSYNEWLAQRGMTGNPYAPQQPQQQSSVSGILGALGKDKIGGIFSSGGGAAGSELASSAGANAAYNAAAMEAGGAPMTLAEIPGAASAPGAFSLSGIGGAGNAFLPAAGVLGGIDLFKNDRGPVRGGLQGAASGAAIGSYFGPAGIIPGAAIGGAVGLAKGLTKHESTRDVARRHTKDLEGVAPDDPVYQAYLRGARGMYDAEPPDPSKPFAGKYSSWDEYKKAGLIAGDLTHVHGNIETYGPEWARLTPAQQQAVVQGNIDADNYHSKKGEVEMTDKNKGKEIFQRIAAEGFKIPVAAPAASPTPMPRGGMSMPEGTRLAPDGVNRISNMPGVGEVSTLIGVPKDLQPSVPAPYMIPRSKTRSPGIDLQGRRIKY